MFLFAVSQIAKGTLISLFSGLSQMSDYLVSSDCKQPTASEVENVRGAVLVRNVLSEEECKKLIKMSEEEDGGYDNSTHPAYQNAKLDKQEMRTRKNDRHVTKVTPEQEKSLSDVLQPFCPPTIEADHYGNWKYWGLNDMYRFYRYIII